jgi:hypothetical protein
MKRTKLLSIALMMLVISTPLVLVVSAGTPQDETPRERRVFIMGWGKIIRGFHDKFFWVNCQPLCMLVVGCGLFKRFLWPNDYISLLYGHFVGFFIPINGMISPVIGMIDYEQVIDEFY